MFRLLKHLIQIITDPFWLALLLKTEIFIWVLTDCHEFLLLRAVFYLLQILIVTVAQWLKEANFALLIFGHLFLKANSTSVASLGGHWSIAWIRWLCVVFLNPHIRKGDYINTSVFIQHLNLLLPRLLAILQQVIQLSPLTSFLVLYVFCSCFSSLQHVHHFNQVFCLLTSLMGVIFVFLLGRSWLSFP